MLMTVRLALKARHGMAIVDKGVVAHMQGREGFAGQVGETLT